MKAKFKIAFSKCFLLLLAILNIPLALFLIIVSPFFKIKIGELEMRSLGHCSTSVEIFLSEMECKIHDIKNFKYVWFINDGDWNEGKKICNNFLMKKWSKKLTIGPRFILEPLFYIFRSLRIIKIGYYFLVPFRHWKDHQSPKNPWQTVDIYNVLPKTQPQIKFTEEEERIGQNYLDKHDLKKNSYIIFFARTSEYRKDQNFASRNSSIFTLIDGLKMIYKEKKIKAVRLGYSPTNKLNNDDKNIIDYSNSLERSEFLDFYLGFNCKFAVGSGTGPAFIAMMNRKKLLYINHGVFSQLHQITNSYVPLIVPKKFKNLNNNKYLSFSEILEKKLTDEDVIPKHLSEFTFVDNDEIEISKSIYEMNDYIDNKLIIDFELQKKFWKIFVKNCGYIPENVNVSPYFLEKYKNLL